MTAINEAKLKLFKLISELNEVYLDRKDLIDVLLIAYLTKEHLFIGGPPGTGKTAMSKDIAKAMSGGKTFYRLIRKTTTVDELIGPIDLVELNNSRFIRNLRGKLADCNLAILDEGFKGNSTCLNALLGLILDREIDDGEKLVDCPLNTMIVCSNELPEEESLAPFWDRLSLRMWVTSLNRRNTIKLLGRQLNKKQPQVTITLDDAELELLRAEIDQVKLTNPILKNLVNVTFACEEDGINTSTRKHNQLIPLLKASALLNNRDSVDEEDLNLLQHILWNKTEDIPVIKQAIAKFSSPEKTEISDLVRLAKQEAGKVQPYNGNGSRSVWTREQSKVTLKLEEIERDIKNYESKKLELATKPFYLKALADVDGMVRNLNQMAQDAYNIAPKTADSLN